MPDIVRISLKGYNRDMRIIRFLCYFVPFEIAVIAANTDQHGIGMLADHIFVETPDKQVGIIIEHAFINNLCAAVTKILLKYCGIIVF